MQEPLPLFNSPISKKRINHYFERKETPLETSDIGYNYTVLASCFLPYRDPGVPHWERRNGKYSLILSAGAIHDPHDPNTLLELGLPYGPKPRIFLCYLNSIAIKRKSPVVPVPRTMTGMIKALGYEPTGGEKGNIGTFKDQMMRLASCYFTVVGPGPRGGESYTKAPPIKEFSVWMQPDQKANIWPSEIILTGEYFESLREHAIPYDIRALRDIQNNARAMDIFLWFSQRLPRLTKPLLMKWLDLFELFGGGMARDSNRAFKKIFRREAFAARIACPGCKMEETPEDFLFYPLLSPVPRKSAPISGS
jgi:hypothetical protein